MGVQPRGLVPVGEARIRPYGVPPPAVERTAELRDGGFSGLMRRKDAASS